MKRIGNPFDEVAARYDAWFDAEEGQIILAEEVKRESDADVAR